MQGDKVLKMLCLLYGQNIQFLPCETMLVWYMLSLCVRPSIRLLHASIVPKRINLGSCKQRHTIAQGL